MQTKTPKSHDRVFVRSRTALRKWLLKNYARNESVWLEYYKPSVNKSDLTYSVIVDVLLCFGWIDSLPRKVDEQRTSVRISPRNPKSRWSQINKEKVARLTKEGEMHPHGLWVVAQAKKRGTWDALNEVENLVLPKDLTQALKRAKKRSAWDQKSRSWKRGRLEMLLAAKQVSTRQKRITTFLAELP